MHLLDEGGRLPDEDACRAAARAAPSGDSPCGPHGPEGRRRAALAAAVLLLLSACSKEPARETVPADERGGNASIAQSPSPAAGGPREAGKGVSIERNDDVLEFGYGWPAPAHAIVPLDRWLKSHAETQYRKAYESAEEGRKTAEDGDFPFHAYAYRQSWKAVADTPEALVMQGDGYSYTGGAHGLPFTVALIWDRAAQRRLAAGDLIDIPRLARAARDAFCKELDRQRAEKRGAPVDPNEDGGIPEFNRCIDMKQQEILPVSRGGKTLDAVRVVIGPYEAGPYAEGSYEIDLPMTSAMLQAVMPAYRGWFGTP